MPDTVVFWYVGVGRVLCTISLSLISMSKIFLFNNSVTLERRGGRYKSLLFIRVFDLLFGLSCHDVHLLISCCISVVGHLVD